MIMLKRLAYLLPVAILLASMVLPILPQQEAKASNLLFQDNFTSWEADTIMEASDILDSATGVFHRWYRSGYPDYHVGYASSTDGVNYTRYSGNPLSLVALKGDRFPYVFEYNGHYYMTINSSNDNDTYMYDVTNPTNPVIMNGGNKVQNNNWEIDVAGVSGTLHALISDPGGTGSYYSYTDLATLNFDTNKTVGIVLPDRGGVQLTYIPERNALLVITSHLVGGIFQIEAASANLSDDLTNAANWHISTALVIAVPGIHVCDPTMVVTNGVGAHNIYINANYNQQGNFTWYSDLSRLDFFDDVVANNPIVMTQYPTNPTMQPEPNERWEATLAGYYQNTIRDGYLEVTQPPTYGTEHENTTNFSDVSGYILNFKEQRQAVGSYLHIMNRYVDDNNWSKIWWDTATNNTIQQERVGGVYGGNTVISVVDALGDLLWHEIRIVSLGNTDNIYVDNIYVGQANPATFINRNDLKVGFLGITGKVRYKNIAVGDLGAGSILATLPASGLSIDKDGVTTNTLNGSLAALNGSGNTSIWFDWGLTPAYGNATTNITTNITGIKTSLLPNNLIPSQIYHYRFAGTSSNGTQLGADDNFTMTMPTPLTNSALNVSMNKDGVISGNFSGNITSMGVATSTYGLYQYGLTAAYGTNTSNSSLVAIGNFLKAIPVGLTPGQTYHYRAALVNGSVNVTGSDQSFSLTMPTVTTGGAVRFGNSALLSASISNLGVASDTYTSFEWGDTAAYGNTTTESTASAVGSFTDTIEPDLLKEVHYRAVIRNGAVYSYGVDQVLSRNSSADISATLIISLGLLVVLFYAITSVMEITLSPIVIILIIAVLAAVIQMLANVFTNL